jgi:hypothetical protein
MSYAVARRRDTNLDANKLHDEDRAVHEWYRFVLSFPPHLVRQYLERFGASPGHCVLDPFCGAPRGAGQYYPNGMHRKEVQPNQ